jgi:mono/diheme cytochrome c family protein
MIRTLRHLGLLLLLHAHANAAALGAEKDAATPRGNPAFTPPDAALFEEGRYVYDRNCVLCHGERGDGKGEMSPSLSIKPRAFSSALFKYRSTPWGKLPTTDDLIRTIRNGRTGTAMGMFTHLRENEIRAVAEYVKSFSEKWQNPENYAPPIELPPEPTWLQDSAELAKRAAAGRQVFLAACASCHGESADGKGLAAAALKDDSGEPATPADLRQPHLRSGDEPGDIYRVLMTGLNGTPMVSFADALTAEQKWEVTAFILTVRRDFRAPSN